MPHTLRTNRILDNLRHQRLSRGAWLFLGSPDVTEVMAGLDLDALVIDLEHTPAGPERALAQLRAAAGSHTAMLARVETVDSPRIKPLLDAGVEGILAPDVRTAEQAESLVAACRYPPRGRRGLHYTVSRAAGWGALAQDYPAHAQANTLVVAMIESAQGVEAIPQIGAVPGIDMLFFGPLDLSASIGLAGRYDAPAFLELWHEGERRCREAGLALGGTVLPGHDARALAARGYGLVTLGADVGFLRQGALACIGQAAGAGDDGTSSAWEA